MRVVLAYSAGADVRRFRQVLLGAGLNCDPDDCVEHKQLATRLSRGDFDIAVVQIGESNEVNWPEISEAANLCSAQWVAVGPDDHAVHAEAAMAAGALKYVAASEFRSELDALVERTSAGSNGNVSRGRVITVFAPLAGCGGTTVATNLAGALAQAHPGEVALIELTPDLGDIGLFLNANPDHTVVEACQRWQSIDARCLRNSLVQHPNGLGLLVNRVDGEENSHYSVDAVRRLSILSRFTFPYTVLAIDGRMHDEELEALRAADRIVVVVRPDVVALRRAQRSLHWVADHGIRSERICLVVNRWGQGGQLTKAQVESTLGRKIDLLIPEDPTRVNKAVNKGMLVREVSGLATISRRFTALATAVNGKN